MHRSHLAKDSRRSPREQVSWQTQIDAPRMASAEALIVDFSPSGCMARSEAILTPGEQVRLRLPVVGHTEARVMWALGGRVGLEFAIVVPMHSYLPMLGEMRREDG